MVKARPTKVKGLSLLVNYCRVWQDGGLGGSNATGASRRALMHALRCGGMFEEVERGWDGAPGLLWSRETTTRTREDRRSSRACRRGLGMAAAARALVGGDGRASAGRQRRLRLDELKGESQGRGEDAAGEGKERGDTGHRHGVARRGRGSRRWPGQRWRSPRTCLSSWQRRKKTVLPLWAGLLRCWGRWAAGTSR